MKHVLFIMGVAFLTSGCVAEKQLSEEIDTYELIQNERQEAGGVQRVNLIEGKKSNLKEIVINYLVYYVNKHVGFNVQKIPMVDSEPLQLVDSRDGVNNILVLKIQHLKMDYIDASLQSVKVNITLNLKVFDKSGEEIYSRIVMGQTERRSELLTVKGGVERLVEMATKNAISQYMSDIELKKIVTKMRYRGVGNLFHFGKGVLTGYIVV